MFFVGGGKQILKDRATIRVNVRDPFYLLNFRGLTDLNKGIANIHSYWYNRRAIISFTYRFDKTNDQPKESEAPPTTMRKAGLIREGSNK